MSKIKLIYITHVLIVLLLVTGGCAVKTNQVATTPSQEPDMELKDPAQYLKRAELFFQKGKDFLNRGELEMASFYFDRVINIFLDSGNNLQPGREKFQYYVDAIAEIELTYFREKSGDHSEIGVALLDEIIAEPLFVPSQKEISELQKKIEDEKPVYSIPVVVNSQVAAFLRAFQTVRHKNIQNALNRSVHYVDEYKRIFKEYGLPEDLAYLPLIESGYRTEARSRARAMGIWQFMSGTAKLFGLQVDWHVDERRDPFKSAHAAAKFLKQVYEKFGDWYLALACYNGGDGRVSRAVAKTNCNDFFTLADSCKLLRRETRNYVPAFLAALIIAKSPEEYGFVIEPSEALFANTKMVQTPSPVKLQDIANATGIEFEKLKLINPELVHDYTPTQKQFYDLRVPDHVDESIIAQLPRVPPQKIPKNIKNNKGWYKVQNGDSLYSIARKFNTSVNKIKNSNNLRNNLIHPGKRLYIPR